QCQGRISNSLKLANRPLVRPGVITITSLHQMPKDYTRYAVGELEDGSLVIRVQDPVSKLNHHNLLGPREKMVGAGYLEVVSELPTDLQFSHVITLTDGRFIVYNGGSSGYSTLNDKVVVDGWLPYKRPLAEGANIRRVDEAFRALAKESAIPGRSFFTNRNLTVPDLPPVDSQKGTEGIPFTFSESMRGYPALAHGGAIYSVLQAVIQKLNGRFTENVLTIRYEAPVLLGQECRIFWKRRERGWHLDLVSSSGKKLASLDSEEGTVLPTTFEEIPFQKLLAGEVLSGLPYPFVNGKENPTGLHLEYFFNRDESLIGAVIDSPADPMTALLAAADAVGVMASMRVARSFGITSSLTFNPEKSIPKDQTLYLVADLSRANLINNGGRHCQLPLYLYNAKGERLGTFAFDFYCVAVDDFARLERIHDIPNLSASIRQETRELTLKKDPASQNTVRFMEESLGDEWTKVLALPSQEIYQGASDELPRLDIRPTTLKPTPPALPAIYRTINMNLICQAAEEALEMLKGRGGDPRWVEHQLAFQDGISVAMKIIELAKTHLTPTTQKTLYYLLGRAKEGVHFYPAQVRVFGRAHDLLKPSFDEHARQVAGHRLALQELEPPISQGLGAGDGNGLVLEPHASLPADTPVTPKGASEPPLASKAKMRPPKQVPFSPPSRHGSARAWNRGLPPHVLSRLGRGITGLRPLK
ncbi:MAG TPA: hypothetical protein DDW49_05595, partial [Deltaproteobacteria bacterium]|nr:hypothetical protein [Deltaproteobacteria bacterium]